MSDAPSPSAVQAAIDLRVAFGRLRRRLHDADSGDELTAAQASVLIRLAKGEATSASALAVLEGVRPQSMAATIAALTELGLVQRTPDPTDGRRRLVALTDAGRGAATAGRQARGEWFAHLIDERCTDAERRTLVEAAAILLRLGEA